VRGADARRSAVSTLPRPALKDVEAEQMRRMAYDRGGVGRGSAGVPVAAARRRTSSGGYLGPDVVINFKNVHDGKCKVRDIELDAKTGTQTVICKDEDQ
jgi:hypothetical protein